jgi:hypothetical protein
MGFSSASFAPSAVDGSHFVDGGLFAIGRYVARHENFVLADASRITD